MVARTRRCLSSLSHSMLLGPGASREGRAGGGGAGRLEVSELPEPRETRASCVTARRPPCQPVGLETDPAPGGSPCVALDAQVRRAAELQGICRLAAAAELGTVARSSPGAVLPRVAVGPFASAPSRLSRFPRFSAGMLLSRIAPISPRALASPGILRLLLRVGVSQLGGPAPMLAFLRVVFICPHTLFPLHRHLFGRQEQPSSLLVLPLGQDLPFLFNMHVCKTWLNKK